jgi:hypothetical protein
LVLAAVVVTGAAANDARAGEPDRAVAAAVTAHPCFGAAARNPISPCVAPSLRLTVFPTPQDALLHPNAACHPMGHQGLLYPCVFGAPASTQNGGVALIGDSHAAAWRAAIDVVAKARDWPAISLTRSGCAFSKARVILPAKQAATCQRWNREVLAWLTDHPAVSTVFLSTRANAKYVRARGASNFETAVQGHLALWRALPATVKNVFVLRDTPYSSTAAADCVQRAYARHQPAGVICARQRAKALHRGPAATAARRLRSPRIHVLDMTPFFCDRTRCYPVVGGALVTKDTEHLTATFAVTLGRFMVPMVDLVMKRPVVAGPAQSLPNTSP